MTALTDIVTRCDDAGYMDSAEGVTGLHPEVQRDPSAREVTVLVRSDLRTKGYWIAVYALNQLREQGWHDTAHVLRRDVLNEGYEPQPSAEYVIEWLRAHGIAVEWTPETERDEP